MDDETKTRGVTGVGTNDRWPRAMARALWLAGTCAVVVVAASAIDAHAQPASASAADDGAARITLPAIGLRARDLALVVNDADPASVEVGRYYAAQRGIAPEHVVHVSFPSGPVMSTGDFSRVQAVLEARVGAEVQAYALAWTLPNQIGCMSATSAFALGYDTAYCPTGCSPSKASPYFNSRSNAPFTDLKLRPAMLLAGNDVEAVKRLIDRGLRADERWPEGKAYLMSTGDAVRNVRAETFPRVIRAIGSAYPIEQIDGDALEGKSDVMFHFTGVAQVAEIASNRFLDGAIADHLTSFGGVLVGAGQTTVLEWLAAGATGSYGATSEPCNFRAKFPEVGIVMSRYLGGESLVEAYWKSVLMPGQGLFVGDPLARPFGGARIAHGPGGTVVRTRALPPGNYFIEAARSSFGPYQPVAGLRALGFGIRQFVLPAGDTRFFRVRAVPEPPRATASEPG